MQWKRVRYLKNRQAEGATWPPAPLPELAALLLTAADIDPLLAYAGFLGCRKLVKIGHQTAHLQCVPELFVIVRMSKNYVLFQSAADEPRLLRAQRHPPAQLHAACRLGQLEKQRAEQRRLSRSDGTYNCD